jgi:hypothetical protein
MLCPELGNCVHQKNWQIWRNRQCGHWRKSIIAHILVVSLEAVKDYYKVVIVDQRAS